ncbi:MAG: alpha/beta fold hydrolase [Microcoleaceae cyanobacterium]
MTLVNRSNFALHTRVQGQGFPIICVHGHPGSDQCMAVFTDHLSKRFKTIAPDLRGYGQSQIQQPFVMETHLADLQYILNRYQIEKCLVLGWSLGGIISMEWALRFPQQVSGLILVATAAYPRGNHPPVTWQDNLYTGLTALVNGIAPGWQWNIDQFGKRSLFRYMVQQHTPTAYRYMAQGVIPAYLQTSKLATQALQQAMRQGYNRHSDLAQIQCPCLVLAGDRDYHITAQSTAETAQRLPQAEFRCYPNTAHLFPWEIPEQVLQDIDQWLAKNPEVVGI